MLVFIGIALVGCASEVSAPAAESPAATSKPSLPIPTTPAIQPTSTPILSPAFPLSVTVTKNEVYAKLPRQDGHVERRLDTYAPTESGDWPIVLILPGADEPSAGQAKLAQAIAEQGAIVFVAEYPSIHPITTVLDMGKGHRELSETVACAIRFARARASSLGIDDTPLAIAGISKGGGVGSPVALMGENVDRRWEEYAASRGGPPRQMECEVSQGSTDVDALIGAAGTYVASLGIDGEYGREFLQEKDFDLWKMLYSSIGENLDLKVRLLHSETDSVVPYENSVEFEAILAEAGYDVELIQFIGDHTPPLELTVKTVMDVFED